MTSKWVIGLLAGSVFGLVLGCYRAPDAKDHPKGETAGKDDHAHGAGPHGGAIADWGGGKYHIEFTVAHDKQEATIYILGSDARKPAPIKAKGDEIVASITGLKDNSTFEITLKAVPEKDDATGKSSRFVARHAQLGVVQEFAGIVTGELDGTPYTGKFKEEADKP